jgi:hypothetical protein
MISMKFSWRVGPFLISSVGEKTIYCRYGSLMYVSRKSNLLIMTNVKGTAAGLAAMPFDMVSGRR